MKNNIERILNGDKDALVAEIASVATWARNLSAQEWYNITHDKDGGLNGVIGRIVDSNVTDAAADQGKKVERVGESAGIFYHDNEELEAVARKEFELAGFEDEPITDEEWAAMEKYPPVPLSDYNEIENQAFRDYVTAIEARPGYCGFNDEAVVDRYLEATRECIAGAINSRKVLPFEVCDGGSWIILPKNRRKIEGDYVVVAKEVIDMEV